VPAAAWTLAVRREAAHIQKRPVIAKRTEAQRETRSQPLDQTKDCRDPDPDQPASPQTRQGAAPQLEKRRPG